MLMNPAVIARLRELHPRSFAVYLCMCLEVGDQVSTQIVCPSLPTLALTIGCSRKSIERGLRELKTTRLIRQLDHRRGRHAYQILPLNGQPACLSDHAIADQEAGRKPPPN